MWEANAKIKKILVFAAIHSFMVIIMAAIGFQKWMFLPMIYVGIFVQLYLLFKK